MPDVASEEVKGAIGFLCDGVHVVHMCSITVKATLQKCKHFNSNSILW